MGSDSASVRHLGYEDVVGFAEFYLTLSAEDQLRMRRQSFFDSMMVVLQSFDGAKGLYNKVRETFVFPLPSHSAQGQSGFSGFSTREVGLEGLTFAG